jgi:FkbM family methyltransferase
MSDAKLPSRQLILNGRKRKIYGSATSDPYFSTLLDESEWPFIHFCQRYIRDDYNCVDVGANVGLMTLYISDYCRSGRIISVEPNGAVFEALQNTIRANAIGNAVPVNVAVTDRDGEVRFSEDSAYGHISPGGNAIVEGVTLATLLSRCGMDRIDFLKIDVEGHEPVILRAALEVIERDKPLIFVEFNSWSLILNHTEPFGFLEWIVATFAYVYVVTHRPPSTELLTRVTPENIRAILQDNLLKNSCVDDLVVTNDPSRLAYSEHFLNKRFRDMQMENAELRRKMSHRLPGLTRATALLRKLSGSATRQKYI